MNRLRYSDPTNSARGLTIDDRRLSIASDGSRAVSASHVARMPSVNCRSSIVNRILCAWVVCLAAAVAGCNIVGPAAYLIEGPPKKDAEHILTDVPTVVFIDDRQNIVNPVSLRRVIADAASGDLMEKKALTTTISSQDAMNLAGRMDRNSKVMSMEEIGKAVGAQQVIYVEMLDFRGSPDNFTPRPTAQCRVRVIDAANRQRVFPPQESTEPGRIVLAMTREVDPELYRTRGSRLRVNEELAHELGREIAKLFYKHEIKELGGSLKPR